MLAYLVYDDVRVRRSERFLQVLVFGDFTLRDVDEDVGYLHYVV